MYSSLQSELIEQFPASAAARSFSAVLDVHPQATQIKAPLVESASHARRARFVFSIRDFFMASPASQSSRGQNTVLASSVDPRSRSSSAPNTSLSGFGS